MKRLIMMLIALSSVFLVGCTEEYTVINYETLELDIENIEYIRCFEYPSTTIEGNCHIIHNIKDLEKIHQNDSDIKQYFDKYDKKFFKKNSLILIGIFDKYSYEYNATAIKNGIIGVVSEKKDNVNKDIKSILFIEAEGKVKKDYVTSISREYNSDDYQYMLSDYSEVLSYNLLSRYYYSGAFEGDSQPVQMSNTIRMFDRIDEHSTITFKEEKDYYTCGYINKDVKDLLDQLKYLRYIEFEKAYHNKWWIAGTGINFYIIRLYYQWEVQTTRGYEGQKVVDNDLIFYDIPKNQEIPKEIGNYFLACITEPRTIIIENLGDSSKTEYEVFIENKYLYENDVTMDEWEVCYKLISSKNKFFIWYDPIFEMHTRLEDGIYTSHDYYLQLLQESLEIYNIDGIEYVNTRDRETKVFDVDIREVIEYKEIKTEEGEINYLFNWEELLEFARNYNK